MSKKLFFSKSWSFYHTLDELKKHDRLVKKLDQPTNLDVVILLNIKAEIRHKTKRIWQWRIPIFIFLAFLTLSLQFIVNPIEWWLIFLWFSFFVSFILTIVLTRVIIKFNNLEDRKHCKSLQRVLGKTFSKEKEYSSYWYYRLTFFGWSVPFKNQKFDELAWKSHYPHHLINRYYGAYHIDEWDEVICTEKIMSSLKHVIKINPFHISGFIFPKLWTKTPLEFGIDAAIYILLNPNDAPSPRQKRLDKIADWESKGARWLK